MKCSIPVLTGFDEMEYTLFIFNRWGQLVFESHDMSVGWDGSYSLKRNDNVQDGAYTWKVFCQNKKLSGKKTVCRSRCFIEINRIISQRLFPNAILNHRRL